MSGKYVKVKEWFFDKVNDSCKGYHRTVIGEYKDGMLDHTILRVSEIKAETEKAIKAVIECESFGGSYCDWNVWIPKSVIEAVY